MKLHERMHRVPGAPVSRSPYYGQNPYKCVNVGKPIRRTLPTQVTRCAPTSQRALLTLNPLTVPYPTVTRLIRDRASYQDITLRIVRAPNLTPNTKLKAKARNTEAPRDPKNNFMSFPSRQMQRRAALQISPIKVHARGLQQHQQPGGTRVWTRGF